MTGHITPHQSYRSLEQEQDLNENRESCDVSNLNFDPAISVESNNSIQSEQNSCVTTNSVNERPTWTKTFLLSYSTLGSIYGDIGTSPLYTLTTIFEKNDAPSRQEVTGVLSLIFWCFTLLVIVKYALIVLQLGPNNGEGGQVAIYCKISTMLNTGPIGVDFKNEKETEDNLLSLSRTETRGSRISSDSIFQSNGLGFLRNKKYRKYFATFTMGLCFLGGSLVISDGLLTPTTSVLSAIEGIGLVVPSFNNKTLPVSVCILIVLFAAQPLGSQYMSLAFSPIMLIWFVTIFVIGCINITRHPDVFKALSPAEAIYYLRDHKSIEVLGSVMLSLTGCEAMFADVGHFSALSVTLALCFVVYPALMLMYLGQGAYLYDHPTAIGSIFFTSIPGGIDSGFYWFVFVIATLATIIASQALILGVFSITKQMIQIDCFPHFKVDYKSAKSQGKIFLPSINFILMVCVVLTCVGFRRSSNVTAAYGLGVSVDFFLTTIFMSICMFAYYKLHWAVVLFFFFTFGSLEMCLIISNCTKIPHGAWFTIMVTVIMFSFFVFWRWCRVMKIKQEARDRKRLQDVLTTTDVPVSRTFRLGDNIPTVVSNDFFVKPQLNKLVRYPGVGIMFTDLRNIVKSSNAVPGLFADICRCFPSLPDCFIFVAVRTAKVPFIPIDERIVIQKVSGFEGFYKCIVRIGFMDAICMDHHMKVQIISQIKLEESLNGKDDSFRFIQIFGKETIKSVKRTDKITFKNCASLLWYGLRKFLIEWIFFPLNELQSKDVNFTSATEAEGEDILTIGKEVSI